MRHSSDVSRHLSCKCLERRKIPGHPSLTQIGPRAAVDRPACGVCRRRFTEADQARQFHPGEIWESREECRIVNRQRKAAAVILHRQVHILRERIDQAQDVSEINDS